MPTLAIAFLIFLNLFSLYSRSGESIELDRDVEYERNPRPDISVPDIFLFPAYPELPETGEPVFSGSQVTFDRESSFQFLFPEPVALYAAPVLSSPLAPSVEKQDNSGNAELTAACRAGWDFNGEYWIEGSGSSFFWRTAVDRQDQILPYGWLGYNYSGRGNASLTAGGNTEDIPVWAFTAEGGLSDHSMSAQYWNREGTHLFRPRLDSLFSLPGDIWTPYFGILAESVLSDVSDFRIRSSFGIRRNGVFPAGTPWEAEAAVAGEFDSFSDTLNYFGHAVFLAKPADFLSVKGFLEIEEFESSDLMYLGLETGALPLFAPAVHQDSGVSVSLAARSWSGSLRSGCKWGSFLRYDGEVYQITRDRVPYGELEITKKKDDPVTDISLYAEYLNREEWQYRAENRWYLFDGRWIASVKAGHYPGKSSDLTGMIRAFPFRTGISALYSSGNQWQFELFTNYLPEDSEIDGGITFRVTF